jgi:phage terminase large subunit
LGTINITLKKNLFIPKFQPHLLDYSKRWEFWVGSAGSGKSYTIAQKIIIRCCNEPIRVLVCRRYATTLRNSCFALFKEILSKWQLNQFVNIRETDMTITFANGSQIILIGLDTEEKLLSLNNISTVWIEEAFEVEKNKVEQLNLRMRGAATNQQIIVSLNPISKSSWLYKFAVEEPPANSIYIHSTFKDNIFLNEEYVAALNELYIRNPQKARVFCDGEWGVDAEGLVFQNWKVEEFNHAEIKGQLMVGLDFGYIHDISALVASLLVEEENRIYIFKCYGATGKTNKELANIIKALGFSKSVIIADSAEPKSIAEIKADGIQKIKPCTKGKDSIMHGIQKLQNYEIVIHPSCEGVITEFENYTFEKDKASGNYINKPIDDFNHYIDALRYSLQCVGAKLKTLDKNLF